MASCKAVLTDFASFDFEVAPAKKVHIPLEHVPKKSKKNQKGGSIDCAQYAECVSYLKTLDKIDFGIPGFDNLFIDANWTEKEAIFKWKTERSSEADLRVHFYVVPHPNMVNNPSKLRSKKYDMWLKLHKCLITQCRDTIGELYAQSAISKSDFLLIATGTNGDAEHILGFLIMTLVNHSYAYEKCKLVEDKLPQFEHLQKMRAPNGTEAEDDYDFNRYPTLFIDLICSYTGAGGKLMALVENNDFREELNRNFIKFYDEEFNTLIYETITLEAVPDKYTYYTLKHKYLRSIDGVLIYPSFRYFTPMGSQYVYMFDKFCDSLNNLEAFTELFKEDYMMLSKYIPYNKRDQKNYARFVKRELIYTPTIEEGEEQETNDNRQPQGNAMKRNAMNTEISLTKDKKRSYRVRVEQNTCFKYITKNNTKVYLKTLKGQYRYV